MKIAIVGLGYVGLPLSLQFARSGATVLGLDVDGAKVKAINDGSSYIKHIEAAAIAKAVSGAGFPPPPISAGSKRWRRSSSACPRRLNKNREPDISYILNTGSSLAPHLQQGNAGGPGIHHLSRHDGRRPARPCWKAGSGLKAGADFHLAFSPEREDPGNPESKVALIPKGHRRLHARVPGTRPRRSMAVAIKTLVPGVFLPRGRSRQADREHLPQRQHRPGQRTQNRLHAPWALTFGR